MAIAIDVASSHFFRNGKYRLAATVAKDTQYLQLKKKPESVAPRALNRPADRLVTVNSADWAQLVLGLFCRWFATNAVPR